MQSKRNFITEKKGFELKQSRLAMD